MVCLFRIGARRDLHGDHRGQSPAQRHRDSSRGRGNAHSGHVPTLRTVRAGSWHRSWAFVGRDQARIISLLQRKTGRRSAKYSTALGSPTAQTGRPWAIGGLTNENELREPTLNVRPQRGIISRPDTSYQRVALKVHPGTFFCISTWSSRSAKPQRR